MEKSSLISSSVMTCIAVRFIQAQSSVVRLLSHTSLFQGLLSDGLLAWRAFVILGRLSWMKWVLIIVISTNFGTLLNERILAACS
jgi:hypothetical protein